MEVTEQTTPKVAVSDPTSAEFPLRAYFGHHKCATSWIDTILMDVCYHMGIHFQIAHTPRHFRGYRTLGEFVRAEQVDFLAYTNANREHLHDVSFHRGFHVVRDPRDVLVSAYYSHKFSHPDDDWPELSAHRAELQTLNKEDGLFCEMEFSQQEFMEMYTWDYEQDHVLELKMEELTVNPVEGFVQIARFLEILDEEELDGVQQLLRTINLRMNRLNQKGRRFMPGRLPMFPIPRRRRHSIPTSLVKEIVQKNSFKRLSGGRKKGEENVRSHYRKGKPGDWQNHLTDAHVRVFKEKYNDLLLKLGYEDSPDW